MTKKEAINTLKLMQAQIEWEYPMDYSAAIDMAIAALAEDPEIIRCKDCKHADEYCHCPYVTWWNSPNDSCSRGKRRKNGIGH